jgi:hypothetical protein
MLTSTKVSLWAAGVGLGLYLLVAALMPGPEDVFKMTFSDGFSTIRTLNVVQTIATIFLIIALISIVVTGFKKIQARPTSQITHIGGHAITATGGSTIATDNAHIDQLVNVSHSSFHLSPDHYAAISVLLKHIHASNLPSVTRNHATLLEEQIGTAGDKKNVDPGRVKSYLQDLVSIADSAKPLAEATTKAIELLTKRF